MKPKPFEHSIEDIAGKTVLLDLDGTLLPDGHFEIEADVRTAILEMKKENVLYLVTNAKDAARARQLADELGIALSPAGAPAGKPRLRSVAGIPTDRPFVVVGDMFITDGILAHRLGAPFIRVSRKYGTKRHPYLYFSHLIDDLVSLFT